MNSSPSNVRSRRAKPRGAWAIFFKIKFFVLFFLSLCFLVFYLFPVQIPDEVTQHFLNTSGFSANDPRL